MSLATKAQWKRKAKAASLAVNAVETQGKGGVLPRSDLRQPTHPGRRPADIRPFNNNNNTTSTTTNNTTNNNTTSTTNNNNTNNNNNNSGATSSERSQDVSISFAYTDHTERHYFRDDGSPTAERGSSLFFVSRRRASPR